MRMRSVFTVAAVLSFVSAPALAQDKLELRLRFNKGDAHRMNVRLEQTIDQLVQGAKQQTRQATGMVYTFTVDDVDAQGNAAISVRYEAVSFHATTPSGAVDYDSAQPPPQVPAAASGLAALVGQGYSMTITPDGKVTQLGGLDKLLSAVLSRLNVADGPARAAAEKSLRQQFNEQNLRANLQNIFAPFPYHPVAIGETWARDTQVSLGFPLVIDSNYTLKGRQGGVASVELTGKSATAPEATVDLGQIRMSYQLHGDLHGSLEIVESTGWTRTADTTQTLTGSATIRAPNAQPQTVPVTIESKMTTREQ